jgi:hypothetical protein
MSTDITKEPQKKCSICKELKPISCFHAGIGIYQRGCRCKPCSSEKQRHRRAARKNLPVTVTRKRCTLCGVEKDATLFKRDAGHVDGLGSWCKTCANKDETRRARVRAQVNATWIVEHGGKCVLCGEDELDVLQISHVDKAKKTMEFASRCSEERLLKELENAQVLCVCCQRVKVYTENRQEDQPCSQAQVIPRERRQKNTEYNRKRKREVGQCALCQRSCATATAAELTAFDWDHLIRAEKHDNVSAMVNYSSVERLEEEIQKCRLLCVFL